MIDLIIQSGTKFALHQWLDARGLGVNVQDTDADSSTFGEWSYTHTHEDSTFVYWNHPSGVVTKNSAGDTYAGFYALLKIRGDIPTDLKTWVSSFTAVSVLDGVAGVGGEGITILDPEDLRSAVVAGGAPLWDGLLGVGNNWSDPRLWAFSNVMTGDQREFDGVTYESLIDFNVWSPTQFPGGWQEVEVAEPAGPEPWVQPTGAQDAYPLGATVTHNGQTWINTGSAANVWAPGVFGWEAL